MIMFLKKKNFNNLPFEKPKHTLLIQELLTKEEYIKYLIFLRKVKNNSLLL